MNKPVAPPSNEPECDGPALQIEALGPPPGLEDLTDEEVDARADLEITAGRFFSNDLVFDWLEARRLDPDLPMPEPDVCDV